MRPSPASKSKDMLLSFFTGPGALHMSLINDSITLESFHLCCVPVVQVRNPQGTTAQLADSLGFAFSGVARTTKFPPVFAAVQRFSSIRDQAHRRSKLAPVTVNHHSLLKGFLHGF